MNLQVFLLKKHVFGEMNHFTPLVSLHFVIETPKVDISLQSTKNVTFAKNSPKYLHFTCALSHLNKPVPQTLCAYFFKSPQDCSEQHSKCAWVITCVPNAKSSEPSASV